MQVIRSILVVEDNEGDFVLLRETLLSGDVQVGEIKNESSLRRVKQLASENYQPTLVFLDLQLPDSYGILALSEVRRLFPAAPIIILSGINDLNLSLEALQQGAQDYLVKGEFDEKLLSRCIQYSVERKKTERALLERENKLLTILNTDPECIKLMGENCELFEINKAGMEMVEIDDFEKAKGISILSVVAPAYKEKAAAMVKAAFTGESGLMEFEMITLKGKHRWCEINIVPYRNAEGAIVNALGVTRDVSARKAKDEELTQSMYVRELIMDSALDAIICIDLQETIFSWNPMAEQLFGWKEEEAIGKKLSAFVIPQRYRHRHAAGFESYIQTGRSHIIDQVLHVPALRANGTEFIAELVVREIKEVDHTFLCTFVRDVTERINADRELKQSYDRFQRITSTTNDAIWEWNLQTNSLWCNETHQHLYGLTINDPIPQKEEWLDRIHPDDRQRLIEMQDNALASDTNVFVSEYRFRTTTGYKHIFDRCYISRNEEGKPVLMTGSMMDITGTKQAEEQLRHSNERFELIARTTNDAVWETDLETGYSWGNEMHQQLYGLSMSDPVPVFEDWKQHIHPNDRDWVIKSLDDALASQDNIWVTEYHFINMKKEVITIYDRTYIVRNADGKPVRLTGSMMDITERKRAEEAMLKSEEKYRTLVQQASDAVFIADPAGRFMVVNPAAVTLSGYTEEELTTMTIYHLANPEELKINPFRFDLMQSAKGASSERRMIRKDGSVVDVEINAKFLSDGRFLAFIRDITERKKAENELNNSYKAIRKLTSHLQQAREEERKHIARNIHDELGQLITVLKMDISWLTKKLKAINDPLLLNKTEEINEMLSNIVNSVRSISADLRPGLLDDLGLTAAIEWHLSEFGKRVSMGTRFITSETEPKLSSEMATGLFRIYQESMTNVARHAGATEVKVELSVQNDVLRMSINDNGKGFDTNAVGKRKTLGLLGMKERTEMMGGEFAIQSLQPAGTSVCISVPLVAETE